VLLGAEALPAEAHAAGGAQWSAGGVHPGGLSPRHTVRGTGGAWGAARGLGREYTPLSAR
jgi:hypothetical protein